MAPAGPADGDRVAAGAEVLASWGLRVRPAVEPGTAPYPWLVDHDEARAEALADAWLDPEVAAVWCVRGGFGAHRILDLLDWHALALATPKLLIGFSDVTALHQAFASRLGVATVHGPMAASLADRDRATRDAFRALLLDGGAVDVPAVALVDGEAEGPLVGGNLTVLATSSGTPLTHPAAGSIAVLEDVGEHPYRLDRSITQLLRAGWFDGVRGVVLGEFTDCGPDPDGVRRLLADRLGTLGVPILADARIGHEDTNLAVPLGVRARIADGVLSFPG